MNKPVDTVFTLREALLSMTFPDETKWHNLETFAYFLGGYVVLWFRSLLVGLLVMGHKTSDNGSFALRACGFVVDLCVSFAAIAVLALGQNEMIEFIYTVSTRQRYMILIGGSVALGITHLLVILLTYTKKTVHKGFVALIMLLYLFANLSFFLPVAIERSGNQEWVAWASVGGVSTFSVFMALLVVYGENYAKTDLGVAHAVGLIALFLVLGFGYASLFMTQFALNHGDAF